MSSALLYYYIINYYRPRTTYSTLISMIKQEEKLARSCALSYARSSVSRTAAPYNAWVDE